MTSLMLCRNQCSLKYFQRLVSPLSSFRGYHSRQGVYGFKPQIHASHTNNSEGTEGKFHSRDQNPNLLRLVEAYHRYGHLKAALDPLHLQEAHNVPELSPLFYGLPDSEKTSDVVLQLEKLYCSSTGVEFMHIESLEEREWLISEHEAISSQEVDPVTKKEIAEAMIISQNFDNFVGSKFPTVKRYGGEGAESCIPFYREIFKLASANDVQHVFMCMAHRGRLNLLTGMLNCPYELMFSKMKGRSELPAGTKGIGDVLSHLTSVTKLSFDGKSVSVTMLPNPSHLEAANPFTAGRVRAEQQRIQEGDYGSGNMGDRVICLQVHGDAAISGQGVVQETLAFSQVPHFTVGGSLHLIVNNQVGYTTPADRGRSSRYCSDIAKSIGVPIIHVNGADPEAVVRAARLAWNYRKKFRRDVFVDVLCYRRWGHNEMDEPTFTNPVMYSAIHSRSCSIPDAYCRKLVDEGVMEKEGHQNLLTTHTNQMSIAFKEADSYSPSASTSYSQVGEQQSKALKTATGDITSWDTGVDLDVLRWVGARSVHIPSNFSLHPTLKRGHVDARLNKLLTGTNLDWSTAESLAIASLLYQGYDCRISGQDVGRGTFSQRHCMLVDQQSNEVYIPLNDLGTPDGSQGHLEVANSILSEEAVLAFEYGNSVGRPDALCIWEAQFGDFFNGAQIIIDTFVTSGEAKWQLQSGLVMVLPHGFDGAGPEHSTCRIERFLQLTDSREDIADCDDINMQVVNPTTPAQIFHLLRRQVLRPFRKPLIVAGPKLLLRFPAAVSTLQDLAPGTSFQPVLDDTLESSSDVRRMIFVSGKHCYALNQQRQEKGLKDVAIIRLEELCPFPALGIQKLVAKYSNAKEYIWCQEEPRNGGAWNFVEPRFRNVVGINLRYSGRPVLAAPAVGISALHKIEVTNLMKDIFSG
ncbi:hypothetical protein GHT06_010655 [Daphnia sinensis]|uniref:Transketolase-like pyrimidine-binding domain-containing protein n=1 Tax=Daphnia sinensis TaxID=1820382 RepID=A0AAD5LJ17_9CRUS|nr:hypothetical protein GHT06_010655 [Daphnia sinensis]